MERKSQVYMCGSDAKFNADNMGNMLVRGYVLQSEFEGAVEAVQV